MRAARSIVLLAGSEVVGKASTLIIVVGAARILPLADFGLFSVALGAGALAAVLPSWGFDTALLRRGSMRPAELPALLAELLALRVAVVAAVVTGFGAAAAGAGSRSTPLIALGCVITACVVDTVTEALRSVAIARESQHLVARVQLVQRGITAALVVTALLVWRDRALLPLSVAYLVGAAIGTVAMAVPVAHIGVRPDWAAVRWPALVRLCADSWPAGVHSVASMALFRIDAVLLAALAGVAAAGRYAAAYRLLEAVAFAAWTVARAVLPVLAGSREQWRVRRGAERGIVVLAAIFLPYAALLAVRGRDVLRLLYGPALAASAAPILTWLAPAPLLFGAGFLAATVLLAAGPPRHVLIGSIGGMVVNLGLNLALIPRLGGVGAGIATSVSYAVEAALLYPLARRCTGRPALGRPLLPAVGGTALAALALLLPIPLGPAVVLAAVVYAAGWLVLARRWDAEQVRVLRALLGRTASRSRPTRATA